MDDINGRKVTIIEEDIIEEMKIQDEIREQDSNGTDITPIVLGRYAKG